MALIDWVLAQNTLFGFLLGLGALVLARLVDVILFRLLERRFFGTIYQWFIQRVKILLTRFNPISATFQFSITPDGSPSLDYLESRIESVLETCEEISEGRIEFGDVRWDSAGQNLQITAEYMDSNYPYQIDIGFTPDSESLQEADVTTTTEADVNNFGIKINFQFAFHNLESALINLSAFVGLLERAFSQEIGGRASSGQFVISPLDNDLTMDDWIEERRFDVSVLLRSEDKRASVEFFNDHAVIDSPYLEIDSDMVDYVRATLLNYYL